MNETDFEELYQKYLSMIDKLKGDDKIYLEGFIEGMRYLWAKCGK